ncbi:hypothetical protein HB364_14060 [Pseudoflavitalea sp. X16]|uniref:hypothetical protein n=1 Tax=Paraflavitalea devenefica TaxID=2716334 RepID=UPI00141FB85A|nr:hypothetical protein [Paraflavitalea devenefica]NII26214.1 hypothetical protein [Paraflavitalea devenefica]
MDMDEVTLFNLSWMFYIGATLTWKEQILWDQWQKANPTTLTSSAACSSTING